MFFNPAYPTYQAFVALGIAAIVTALLMPLWIKLLKIEGIGQQVRADGPKRHLVKQGTPTMGGVVILLGIVVSCLLLAQPRPPSCWLPAPRWPPVRWACSMTLPPWRRAARLA